MLCSCRVSCFCRLQSSYRCCRSSRRLRRLINGRRHAGTATASCRAIISPRITPSQLTPRKLRFHAWRVITGAPGISIQPQVITGTMATGTISVGLAFTAVATMAAASALAGRGRRSGRSGIAADIRPTWQRAMAYFIDCAEGLPVSKETGRSSQAGNPRRSRKCVLEIC